MHNLRQMLNFYIPLSEKGSQLLSQKIIPRHEFIELSYLQSRQGPSPPGCLDCSTSMSAWTKMKMCADI